MSCVEKECLFYRRHSEITEMSLDGANERECMEYYSGSLVYSKLVHSIEFPLWYLAERTCFGFFHSCIQDTSWWLSQAVTNCARPYQLYQLIANGDLIMLLLSISSHYITTSCRMDLVAITPYLSFCSYVVQTVLPSAQICPCLQHFLDFSIS